LIRGQIVKIGKMKELIKNEIKILKNCISENIVFLYDVLKTKDNLYLICEYCDGKFLNLGGDLE